MTATNPPLLYLVLGASGSGRREIILDLVETSREHGEKPAVLLAEWEATDAFDARLPIAGRWRLHEEAVLAELPGDATRIFFLTDGRANPVDQVEAFQAWMLARGGVLARVLCVVNCQLAEKNPALLAWYEACVHFADVVLLNRREGVANKWFSDFTAHFSKKFYPCVFELVKRGRVPNPLLVLEPEARRMSHVFDEEPEWTEEGAGADLIVSDENEEAGDGEDEEDDIEAEPYFQRDAAGRRVKRIPDIAKYLPG